jgi:hypothetical protein
VRNALRGPKRLCVLRSVKRKKNVQGGVQDKVGCTTMVSTVVLAINDDMVFGVDDLAYSPESHFCFLLSVLVG